VRKLEKTDFEAAATLRRGGLQPAEWWVGKYELRGDAIVDVSSQALEWRRYRPLEEAKDLFFEFVRLYESEDFAASALGWVKRYGFPIEFYYEGLKSPTSFSHILAGQSALELVPEEEWRHIEGEPSWQPLVSQLWQQSREDPPSMTIEELQAEAYLAWDTLAHYEAYVNHEQERALYLPNGDLNPRYDAFVKRTSKERALKIIRDGARRSAEATVTDKVNEHCFLTPLGKEFHEGPESRWAWGFQDLRGAMYLQMKWVMERGVTVGRCKWCNEAFPRRGPQGHKSPRTKRFCNDACRMAYTRARAQ
jgi:hypothetical protein